MKEKTSVLIVEDDKNMGFILKSLLGESGYKVEVAENGDSAMSLFTAKNFDICLVDVMLPSNDGFYVAEEMRRKNTYIPIIFVTARLLKEDKIKGFHLGADDYITKPFSNEELMLRIEAVLRRSKANKISNNIKVEHEVFSIGKFVFDYTNQVIKNDDTVKKLTNKEAELLHLLCINKNQLVRRNIALKLIWGEDDYFMGRSMDVYITKLRKILKADPNLNIQNIHHTGFMLEVKE